MKKILLLTAAAFSLANIFAQPCIPKPDWNKPGISPGRLADAEVGVPYNQTITFVVPLDTSAVFNGTPYNVRIDSAKILYIKGYPEGFNYEADKQSLTYNGGTKGCAKLTGTATSSQTGNYSIWVKVDTWFKIVGLPNNQFEQIDSSQIDFKVVMPNTIRSLYDKKTISSFPNPVKNILTVDLNSYSNAVQARVYDILGNSIKIEPIPGNELKYNTADLKSGIYFIEVKDGKNLYVIRFIKE